MRIKGKITVLNHVLNLPPLTNQLLRSEASIKWFDHFLSVFGTSIQAGVELNCLMTDLYLRSSIYRVFQPNACIS